MIKSNRDIYSEKELARIRGKAIPRHIAIVPDGNRRWARKNCLEALIGHRTGSETLVTLVEAAEKLGIKILTVYAFSTENWKRAPHEVDGVMEILAEYLRSQREIMVQRGVKLAHIGDITPLPDFVKEEFLRTEEATSQGKTMQLVLAVNYGGRDEICRAVRRLAEDCKEGKLQPAEINEEMIASYLDTSAWGDPDLLIRTSGEYRISNFLLWQTSYSEFLFVPTLWPDFGPQELLESVVAYQKREQRLGT